MQAISVAGSQIFGNAWPVIGAILVVLAIVWTIAWFILPFLVYGIFAHTGDQQAELTQIKKLIAKQLGNQISNNGGNDDEELL